MKKLAGKVAIVTGSGRGIGRALALKLASEGAKVVVNDLDQEPANEVVASIKALGSDAVTCVASVTDVDFGDKFVKTALESFGRLDIIVNNAGYTWDGFIGKMSDEQFDAMIDVHLKAPFRVLRAAAPYFAEQSKAEAAAGQEVFRKVVNISSIAGICGNMGQVNYSSAKAALSGMTKTLAKEWGRMKVNVNCVGFGVIETRLTQATDEKKSIKVDGGKEVNVGIPTKVVEGFKSMIPLGRAGTPEEAAGAVYLFCAPESDYISGQVIVAGGGLMF